MGCSLPSYGVGDILTIASNLSQFCFIISICVAVSLQLKHNTHVLTQVFISQ